MEFTSCMQYTHVHGQLQTVLPNACKHANANKHANSSLRLTRGRFPSTNAIAICVLDLKLSGCTIDVDFVGSIGEKQTGKEIDSSNIAFFRVVQ